MTLKLAKFCDDPKKISTKSSYPQKIFIFLKTPKNIEIQNFEPPKNSPSQRMCTPPPPRYKSKIKPFRENESFTHFRVTDPERARTRQLCNQSSQQENGVRAIGNVGFDKCKEFSVQLGQRCLLAMCRNDRGQKCCFG